MERQGVSATQPGSGFCVRAHVRHLLGRSALRSRSSRNAFREAISGHPDDDSILTPFAIEPYPFQRQILERLQVDRHRGHRHNLVVAATGTGKTIIAALDYRTLRTELDRSRLLFVAHRSEILEQSQTTFRHVLRDGSFGELWVGGRRPSEWQHVFASIQSLSARDATSIDPTQFDVVIVDEFHHAAANTYEALLDHLRPKHLLGLTATPERTDGLDVLRWFGDRISVELRLWDALEQGLLSTFSLLRDSRQHRPLRRQVATRHRLRRWRADQHLHSG